jgi:hypothetical protein
MVERVDRDGRIISQLVAFFWGQSGFATWYLAAQLDWTRGYLRAPVCEVEGIDCGLSGECENPLVDADLKFAAFP